MGRPCRCCFDCCCGPWIIVNGSEYSEDVGSCVASWDLSPLMQRANELGGYFQFPASWLCASGGCSLWWDMGASQTILIDRPFTVKAKLTADVEQHNSGYDRHYLSISAVGRAGSYYNPNCRGCYQRAYKDDITEKCPVPLPFDPDEELDIVNIDGCFSHRGKLVDSQTLLRGDSCSSSTVPPQHEQPLPNEAVRPLPLLGGIDEHGYRIGEQYRTPVRLNKYEYGLLIYIESDMCYTGCKMTTKSADLTHELPSGCYSVGYSFISGDDLWHEDLVGAFSFEFTDTNGDPIAIHPRTGICKKRDFVIYRENRRIFGYQGWERVSAEPIKCRGKDNTKDCPDVDCYAARLVT